MGFPQYLYHPEHGGREFLTQQQADALGAGWVIPRGEVPTRPSQPLKAAGEVSPVIYGDALRLSDKLAFYIVWGPGVTSGEIAITTAHDHQYTGRWARRLTLNFVNDACIADSCDWVSITNTGIHAAIRVEITAALEGGFVTIVPLAA